jgi:ATP-binding protein involved in chromosome partitioning
MSFLVCPHCGENTYTFGKGGGQKISDKFSVPYLGEIPLHPLIREGSDLGRPVTLVEPESLASLAFVKISKLVAGRISVIAASVKDNDIAEKASTTPM